MSCWLGQCGFEKCLLWAETRPLLCESHAQALKMRIPATCLSVHLLPWPCSGLAQQTDPGPVGHAPAGPALLFADSDPAQRPCDMSTPPVSGATSVCFGRFSADSRLGLFFFFSGQLLSFISCKNLALALFSRTGFLHSAASEEGLVSGLLTPGVAYCVTQTCAGHVSAVRLRSSPGRRQPPRPPRLVRLPQVRGSRDPT